MTVRVRMLPDAAAVASAAADRIVAALEAARAGSRRCAVALSGGSGPPPVYRELVRRARAGASIPWAVADWYWGDERAVPPDHPDSNYRLAREHLLAPLGIPEANVFRMPAERGDHDTAARAYEALLRERLSASASEPSMPVFDLVWLGMGPDGHTASLFPGTAALAVRDRAVVMHHVPAAGMHRMTLTFPVLNAAREVILPVTGEAKAERIREVLGPEAVPGRYPVQNIRPLHGALEWLLDPAAASGLGATVERRSNGGSPVGNMGG